MNIGPYEAMEFRPKLEPGYKWGENISWSEVKPGDEFSFLGNRSRGRTGGTIKKINKSTFVFVTVSEMYPKPSEHVGKKSEYTPGSYVVRGKVLHEIV